MVPALLHMSAASESPDQQSKANRKLLADVRAKAQKGDAQSQYELGRAFDKGSLGAAKDEV
jgi:TPR repeat protein